MIELADSLPSRRATYVSTIVVGCGDRFESKLVEMQEEVQVSVVSHPPPLQYPNIQLSPVAQRMLASMEVGFSRKLFHRLEKRAIVAPSTTRWSALQLTAMECTGTSSSWPVTSFWRYSGTLRTLPMAPMATCGIISTGEAYVPPIVPMFDSLPPTRDQKGCGRRDGMDREKGCG